jgi:effector-binding domain-containing protein
VALSEAWGIKQIGEQEVVGVRRFVHSEAEIVRAIEALRQRLGDAVEGPPVCLYLARDPKRGLDVEICVPVRVRLDLKGTFFRRLDGGTVIWARHLGPLDPSSGAPGLQHTVRSLWNLVEKAGLLVGDEPRRSLYLEGPEQHPGKIDNYVTEVQISYHLPAWIDALDRGLRKTIGPSRSEQVIEGHGDIRITRDTERIRHWVETVLDRLDQEVPDERTRSCIMNGCAHRHPRPQLERWSEAYRQSSNLEAFVTRLETDKDLYPPRTWREPGKPDLLYVERVIPPGSEEAVAQAATPEEKRFHTCFCVMMRDAILRGEHVSPSFCHCSGGWFVQIWEAILGRTLQVDVVRSVLRGADRCVFAVHLPPELL